MNRSEKKNILFVIPVDSLNGATIACISFANTLDKSKFATHLVFPNYCPAAKMAMDYNLSVHYAPMAWWFCGFEGLNTGLQFKVLIRYITKMFPSVIALVKLIEELKIHIVYANTSTAVAGVIAGKIRGRYILWHIREIIDRSNYFGRKHIAFIERNAHQIIVTSDAVKTVFEQTSNISTVYDGVINNQQLENIEKTEAIRKEWSSNGQFKLIGMVGRFEHYKGSYLLLNTIPEVISQYPSTKYVFIGGEFAPNYNVIATINKLLRRLVGSRSYTPINEIRKLGVEDNVILSPWMPNVMDAMHALDLVVFPSIIPEGFGLPQVEAGFVKKPVITFNIGAAPEIIENGKTGLILQEIDVPTLSRAIISLLKDNNKSNSMGLNAYRHVCSKFTFPEHANKISKIIYKMFIFPNKDIRTEKTPELKIITRAIKFSVQLVFNQG